MDLGRHDPMFFSVHLDVVIPIKYLYIALDEYDARNLSRSMMLWSGAFLMTTRGFSAAALHRFTAFCLRSKYIAFMQADQSVWTGCKKKITMF